jgi:hypothetical protein
MSGWASAALDINAPAPMVAASAAAILAIAILNDINLSTVIGDPFGGVKFYRKPAKPRSGAVLPGRILTARANRQVSAGPRRAEQRKCRKQSKCPENNTR